MSKKSSVLIICLPETVSSGALDKLVGGEKDPITGILVSSPSCSPVKLPEGMFPAPGGDKRDGPRMNRSPDPQGLYDPVNDKFVVCNKSRMGIDQVFFRESSTKDDKVWTGNKLAGILGPGDEVSIDLSGDFPFFPGRSEVLDFSACSVSGESWSQNCCLLLDNLGTYPKKIILAD